MSSSFQSLRDLKKKNKKNEFRNMLFMKDHNLPISVNSNYYKKNKNIERHSKLYRCVLTGRSKFVLTNFKLTRMAFKCLGSSGLIPGVTKSSY